jgi:hypothetical protein
MFISANREIVYGLLKLMNEAFESVLFEIFLTLDEPAEGNNSIRIGLSSKHH